MNYLIYIEHAAENLQFWLWHRDYTKRFHELSPNERNLAPEWITEQAEAEALASQSVGNVVHKNISPEAAAVFRGSDFAPRGAGNPFNTPPRTPTAESREKFVQSDEVQNDYGSTMKKSFNMTAATAFEKADLKWQPCRFTFVYGVQALIDYSFSHYPAFQRRSISHYHDLYSRRFPTAA